MFDWLKKLFRKERPLEAKLVGQPIHFNVSPDSKQAQLRHLARIIRLAQAAEETRDAERVDAYKREIAGRKNELAKAGIEVPGTLPECERLLKEMNDG